MRIGRSVLVTWLVTALWDFLCATALSVFAYHSTFSRLWAGIGVVAVKRNSVAAGIAIHFVVAFVWSALFVLVAAAAPALRRAIARPSGALAVAAIYGPLIWLVMSIAIIPLSTGKLPAFGLRWWVQIFAHVPFVTIPVVFTARRMLDSRALKRNGRGPL